MSNTRYSVYRSNTFNLAKTLVIKCEMTAEAINTNLIELGYEVLDAYPETWKYYKNIAGEYHLTDTVMTVVSLDTLEVIEFTKANLAIHRATAKGYAYGTRYYNELVARFPTQDMLILGILYPVDINKAINAHDGEILYFNQELVEENEYSLIPNIQRLVDIYFVRWNVADYRLTDPLYPTVFLANLFSFLPAFIMDLRTASCKTNEAHSYHIREYLASNGKLDSYMDVLDKRQALFLYRNIKYIHHNAGKKSTFDLLVDRILSARNFPLAAYNMRHNTSGMPTSLLPSIELVQYPLNLQQVEGRDDVITVSEMLNKEIYQARDNDENLIEKEAYITDKMQTANTDFVQTKILESIVVDNSDEGPYRFADTLLNEWVHLSFKSVYQGVVAFVDPSNGDTLTLSTADAFVFYLYCVNRSFGVTLPTVPTIQAINVRRLNIPTLAELQGMVDSSLISNDFLLSLLDDVNPITNIISAESFFITARAIHQRLLRHRLQYSSIEHQEASGMARAAAWRFYIDSTTVLAPSSTSYSTWLHDKGLSGVSGYSAIDFEKFATNISVAALGIDNNSAITLKDIQNGALRLMSQLSSYTVQYIPTINTEPYVAIDWAIIRQGDVDIKEHQEDFVKNAELGPLAMSAHMKAASEDSAVYEDADYNILMTPKTTITEEINIPKEYNVRPLTHLYGAITTLEVQNIVDIYYPPPEPVNMGVVHTTVGDMLRVGLTTQVLTPFVEVVNRETYIDFDIVESDIPRLDSLFSSTYIGPLDI